MPATTLPGSGVCLAGRDYKGQGGQNEALEGRFSEDHGGLCLWAERLIGAGPLAFALFAVTRQSQTMELAMEIAPHYCRGQVNFLTTGSAKARDLARISLRG